MGFIPGRKRFSNIHKSINVIYHINKLKNKNHKIISIDAKKDFDKIQHQFIIRKKKISPEDGIDRTYLNKIQAIYDKPTANNLCSGEKLKVCPLNSRTKQEYSL